MNTAPKPNTLDLNENSEPLVASRSDSFIAANTCVALISAAGVFLSDGLVHRAAYATVIVATYFGTQWLVRCVSATLRDDINEARNLATMSHVAWSLQKLALGFALGLTVLNAPGVPSP